MKIQQPYIFFSPELYETHIAAKAPEISFRKGMGETYSTVAENLDAIENHYINGIEVSSYLRDQSMKSPRRFSTSTKRGIKQRKTLE